MIKIFAHRIAFNGTRRVIREEMVVDTIEDIEALRLELKAKYKSEYIDFFYKTIKQ